MALTDKKETPEVKSSEQPESAEAEAAINLEELQASNEELQTEVAELQQQVEELQASNEELQTEAAELQQQVEGLTEGGSDLARENEALQGKLAKAGLSEKEAAPVKMEKPGKFYASKFFQRDPYNERCFHPDESRAVEVKPMDSWTDCQIKAGVLLRAK